MVVVQKDGVGGCGETEWLDVSRIGREETVAGRGEWIHFMSVKGIKKKEGSDGLGYGKGENMSDG